ncbi:MAG: riboflavin biosynthesis protein RibF [Aeoliella sp.]
MHVIRHVHDLPPVARGGAVAIGNFDGVHLGHARIVSRLLERAKEVGGPAVVFTFDPHPARLLRPKTCPPPLTWTERKAELLADLGIDWVVAYPTDHALLSLSPREFFDRVIREVLAARAIVEGPNFYFGKDRGGNVEKLGELAAESRLTLDVVTPLEVDGELISSSRVREAVRLGQVGNARRWLTAPYRIRGLVTHGAGRGTKLGFPTANLDGVDTLLPALGVYAGVASIGNRRWPAAIHLGPNPTFGERATKVEVHLISAEETIYGQILEVEFLERLRDVQSFDEADKLTTQLREDVNSAERIGNEYMRC